MRSASCASGWRGRDGGERGNGRVDLHPHPVLGGEAQFPQQRGPGRLQPFEGAVHQHLVLRVPPGDPEVLALAVGEVPGGLRGSLDQVPKRQEALDSIALERNDAYYQLGLIYKEQFGEYQIAAEDFETFLGHDPVENLVLPAKYHLFKTYAYFNEEMSNKYRDDIVTNYPDSRYAEMILNPRNVTSSVSDDKGPESMYKSAFICYEEEDFSYALRTVNDALARFKGHEMEAKFELLKAYLLLKTEGEEAFIDKLQYVIVNFPSTTESEHAEEALQKMAKRSMEQPREN